MEAIQEAWTLPGWAHPTCRAIVADTTMDKATKYDALVHNLGLANGKAGAAPVTEQKKGLTNDYVLGFIPEGRKGIAADELRSTLAKEGFSDQQISLAIGRLTKQGKQLVEQGGILFRAPAQQATGDQRTQAEDRPQPETQQVEHQETEPLRATG